VNWEQVDPLFTGAIRMMELPGMPGTWMGIMQVTLWITFMLNNSVLHLFSYI